MNRNIIKLLLLITTTVCAQDDSKSHSFGFISDSPLKSFQKAAVVSNVPECADIGLDFLKNKNGSAVDAAIAVLICEGVASPISLGIGGGFLMTIYDASNGEAVFLNAKEIAPGLANATMFRGNASLSFAGGLAIAVPGEVMGYWEAHKRFGRIPWKDLFEPSIELCENGVISNDYNDLRLKFVEKEIKAEPSLSEFLIDPKTNELYVKGDKIKRLKLGKTLRKLADASQPVDLFYRGELTKHFVADIKKRGGIITEEDFVNYKVKWTVPHRAQIDNMTIYTSPPSGSGVLLTFMLKVLKGLVPAENDKILWQRFLETFKFAYAKRAELADPDFVNLDEVMANLTSQAYIDRVISLIKKGKTSEDPKYYGAATFTKNDAGTAHISILAPDGSAVSVTSTINQDFGSQVRSRSTGVIFNDQMDDFGNPGITNVYSVPPSPKNFIQAYKRPLSSTSPTIVVNQNGEVIFVIGSSGGTKIPTTIANVMSLYFWNDYNLKEAVDAYRLHHQLFPMYIHSEPDFPEDILDYLRKLGHKNRINDILGTAVTAIARENEVIVANADYRRGGAAVGF
ncbi:scoloptoxin SSD14-like [Phymastichus coffea]|uniref:scoloptoxin SSD14-like n=1 Tax=Phymastichus coffea TaxID=108790 RepID=UPI00273ACBEB|nr:scoloptoxin SSD14-like [Phymastichus coffea]